MKKSVVIMAAGMGSRFGGLKQLSKFGAKEETLLDMALQDALAAGFKKAVFVIRRDIEKDFRAALSGKYEDKMDVRYAFQDLTKLPLGLTPPEGRAKPWGTGHAVLCAKEEIAEPFLAINADDYYGPSSYRALGDFLNGAEGALYALAGYSLKNTLSENGGVSRGVCECDAHGFLKSVREFTGLQRKGLDVSSNEGAIFDGEELVSLNFWAFTPDFLDILSNYFEDFISKNISDPKAEFYLPFAVDRAVKEGRAKVRVVPTAEVWQGVTYKEDKPAVEAFLQKNRAGFR